VHCVCGFTQHTPSLGLGDYVAAGLHAIGITKQRYVAIKRLLGLKPQCRCKERREKLNNLGRRLNG